MKHLHFFALDPWAPERLFWNDGGDGGGSGEGEGGEGEGSGGEGGGSERTFSQADVDRIVQDRLARDRKDRPSEDEIKQMREAQTRLAEIEAENQSELEKAQAQAAKLQQELDDAKAAAEQTSLRSSLLAEAAKPDRKIVDPQGAVDLLVSVDTDLLEDGDIAKAMDSLLEKRPYLVAAKGTARAGGADQGARGGGKNQLSSTEGMSPAEIDQARREGRLDDYLAGRTS